MSTRYFHFLYREFVFLLPTNDFSGCFGISISGFFFFFASSTKRETTVKSENRCFRRVREISVCLVRVVEFVIFLKIYGLISKKNRRYFFGFWFQCACGESIGEIPFRLLWLFFYFLFFLCVYCVTPETIALRTVLHEGWHQLWLTVGESGPFITRVLIAWAQWAGFGRSWCKLMYQDFLVCSPKVQEFQSFHSQITNTIFFFSRR